MKDELKVGDASCKHSYTRQEKLNFQVLVRVCPLCGREEIVCDNELISPALARQLLKR